MLVLVELQERSSDLHTRFKGIAVHLVKRRVSAIVPIPLFVEAVVFLHVFWFALELGGNLTVTVSLNPDLGSDMGRKTMRGASRSSSMSSVAPKTSRAVARPMRIFMPLC